MRWITTVMAVLAALLIPAASATRVTAQALPAVAAASDLRFALEEVAATFTKQSGARVNLVFGSSGNLTRQLRDGAPFDIFLSADEAVVEQLAAAGLTRDRGALYAIGRLVIFAPRMEPLMSPAPPGIDVLWVMSTFSAFAPKCGVCSWSA